MDMAYPTPLAWITCNILSEGGSRYSPPDNPDTSPSIKEWKYAGSSHTEKADTLLQKDGDFSLTTGRVRDYDDDLELFISEHACNTIQFSGQADLAPIPDRWFPNAMPAVVPPLPHA